MDKVVQTLHPQMIEAVDDLIKMVEIEKLQRFISTSYEILVGSKTFDARGRDMRKDNAG
mgnify:FL=1